MLQKQIGCPGYQCKQEKIEQRQRHLDLFPKEAATFVFFHIILHYFVHSIIIDIYFISLFCYTPYQHLLSF